MEFRLEKKLLHRRSFLKTATGTTVAAIAGLTQAGRVLAQDTISQKTPNKESTNALGQMETRHLGSFLEVSAIGLGCLPAVKSESSPSEKNQTIALIRNAYANGVTFFDAERTFGPQVCEEWIGKALSPARQNVKIVAKFGGTKLAPDSRPDQIRHAVENSLRRLHTDYIDLLFQRQEDPKVSVEEVASTVKDLIREGKVLNWGLTDPTAETIRKAQAICPLAAVQSEYSIWWREPERRLFPTLEAFGIGFVPYGALGYGYFTGTVPVLTINDYRRDIPQFAPEAIKHNLPLTTLINKWATRKEMTPCQFALVWMLSKKPWIVPMPGTSDVDHLIDLLGAKAPRLTAWEMDAFDQDVAKLDLIGLRQENYLQA